MIINVKDIEILHILEEYRKGVSILKVFEIEAQNYKYGKGEFCNVIKKQIEGAFEFTAEYARLELNAGFDEYVACYLDPDDKAEFKALNQLLEYLQSETPASTPNNSPFSALEWATIFYYANTTKLLPDAKTTTEKMAAFMKVHGVETTPGNFKTKFYEASRRINKKMDYPIDKLESITPFLADTYPETVTKIENDKEFLEEEQCENQYLE